MSAFDPVPERFDFPAAEEQVRRFWNEREIFRRSLDQREGAPNFVFYEGPPTANGRPHNGHVLTRVIKDLFPRYKTMRGFRVPRKAGWDTHGLPVEIEVEKALGIRGKEGIVEYGVEAFIKKCVESVFVYTKEWEELTERIGFWVDLSDAYVTYHQSYVESVWWSLRELFAKGLLYQDRKVVWWWPQGGTTLSAAEVGDGYREVDDPSLFVRFRDAGDEALSYLAWTTTPWTLPSNVALAVRPTGEYVEVTRATEDGGTERIVVAAALAERVFAAKRSSKKPAKGKDPAGADDAPGYSLSPPFRGVDLVGRRYHQLLPFRAPEGGKAFEIVGADFVSIDASQEQGSGTGIVHIAPAFGEDDHRVAREHGLGFLQLVDEEGRMTADCEEFAGEFCKAADRGIIRRLRAEGKLLREEVYRHDYPFCPRARDDALIQLARPAWFIATSRFKDALLANNRQVRWIPEHIRDGRFGKFLADNVDWALSRERFWGTPLPIWRCEKTGHLEAMGSYAELLAKPGVEGVEVWEAAKAADPQLCDDLKVHKPYIDAITFRSPKDATARMRRVTEVIDCWYDSGAMPFAQWGYPHASGSAEKLAASFPADIISEAIDQTRGWFYSLLAESTLLHEGREGPHPYRTCIVLGHVCDKDGVKESKRLGNYTAPKEALDTLGADAIRWYFYSQGQPWTNARYGIPRVGEAKKDFLIRLQNVWSFFAIYARIDGFDPSASNRDASDVDSATLARGDGYRPVAERTLLDRWILSELQATTRQATDALDDWDILGASRALFDLVDNLSNWYVRRSRSRFWGSGMSDDKLDAFWTLYECLVSVARLAAPFVPFFSDVLWRHLVVGPWGDAQRESVHLADWPQPSAALEDRDLSRRMAVARELVELGRAARVEAKLRVRQPLREAIVVLADASLAADIADLLPIVEEELNVKQVGFAEDVDRYVEYELRPNFKAIGPRLGRLVQELKGALANVDAAALRVELDARGACSVQVGDDAVELSADEIEVRLTPKEGYAARSSRGMVLILDTEIDEALRREGQAREVVAAANSLRGERGLAYQARVRLRIGASDALGVALREHEAHVAAETLAVSIEYVAVDAVEGGKEGRAGDEIFVVGFDVVP